MGLLKTILPIVGAAAGSIVAPGIGTSLGYSLGNLAGNKLDDDPNSKFDNIVQQLGGLGMQFAGGIGGGMSGLAGNSALMSGLAGNSALMSGLAGNSALMSGLIGMQKGGIYINPKNKGKFTAYAKSHNMGVQEMANKVMSNKEDYSPTIVKRANFAKNANSWNKQSGGEIKKVSDDAISVSGQGKGTDDVVLRNNNNQPVARLDNNEIVYRNMVFSDTLPYQDGGTFSTKAKEYVDKKQSLIDRANSFADYGYYDDSEELFNQANEYDLMLEKLSVEQEKYKQDNGINSSNVQTMQNGGKLPKYQAAPDNFQYNTSNLIGMGGNNEYIQTNNVVPPYANTTTGDKPLGLMSDVGINQLMGENARAMKTKNTLNNIAYGVQGVSGILGMINALNAQPPDLLPQRTVEHVRLNDYSEDIRRNIESNINSQTANAREMARREGAGTNSLIGITRMGLDAYNKSIPSIIENRQKIQNEEAMQNANIDMFNVQRLSDIDVRNQAILAGAAAQNADALSKSWGTLYGAGLAGVENYGMYQENKKNAKIAKMMYENSKNGVPNNPFLDYMSKKNAVDIDGKNKNN